MTLSYRDRDTSDTHFDVLCGSLRIGMIYRGTARALHWRWTFFVSQMAPPGFEHDGNADTVEDAKAAVERNWRAWLKAAGLSDVV